MDSETFDFEKVKNDLLKNDGGEIKLDKRHWDDGIAIIWLNHTEKRNSVTGKMMVDLMYCIEELEKWNEGKAVIISGKGLNFCSGGDLDFVKLNAHPNNASNMSKWMISTLRRLANLDLVTVCAVHGATLGGGVEISTFCDYILVGENVKYGFIQGNLGIITAWGGGTRLVQKVGQRKALDLFLTSKILTAEECVRMSLAEKIISSDHMIEDTLKWLEGYIKHHHQVIRSYKRLVNTSRNNERTDRTFEIERKLTKYLWGGEEHIRQINKFKNKSTIKYQTDAQKYGNSKI